MHLFGPMRGIQYYVVTGIDDEGLPVASFLSFDDVARRPFEHMNHA